MINKNKKGKFSSKSIKQMRVWQWRRRWGIWGQPISLS